MEAKAAPEQTADDAAVAIEGGAAPPAVITAADTDIASEGEGGENGAGSPEIDTKSQPTSAESDDGDATSDENAKPPESAPNETVEEDPIPPAQKRQLELVYIHCAMNMAVSILNFSTRTELLKEVLAKNGADPKDMYSTVAWYLSMWTGSTAFCEFFLNPTIGTLSDTYGRKPFMVLAPYAAIVLKAWVLAAPSITSLTIERIMCDGLRTLSGSTMGAAAVADLVPKSQLAKGFSGLWSRMGIALIGSPLLASQLNARQSYKMAMFFAVLTLINDQILLEETLPLDSRKPFVGIATPFSLSKLFTGGRALRYAAITMALQNLLDPKILADPWVIFQLGTLKWSREYSQMFTAVVGFGLLAGSKLNTIGIDTLGLNRNTTACHLTTIVGNVLLGIFPSSFMQWLSGLLGYYGDQRTNGVKQVVANLAVQDGIARGEMSGLTANLRALMVIFGPVIFSASYTAGKSRGVPGAPFLTVAVICALAELAHQQTQAAVAAEKRD